MSRGGTGHYEAVKVVYDPSRVTYAKLLDVFWHNIDPLDAGVSSVIGAISTVRQFFMRMTSRSALPSNQRPILSARGASDKPIVTPIVAATAFYPAEEYHQDYYKKNPLRYHYYRTSCGRDRRLARVWGADAAAGTH